MKERRALVEGLAATPPPIDPALEREFVYGETRDRTIVTAPVHPRSPISTRIRSDFAKALKRASLERQLRQQNPHRLQDILEEALAPWLKSNGYLP